MDQLVVSWGCSVCVWGGRAEVGVGCCPEAGEWGGGQLKDMRCLFEVMQMF